MGDKQRSIDILNQIEYLAGRADRDTVSRMEASRVTEGSEFGILKEVWEATSVDSDDTLPVKEREAWAALEARINSSGLAQSSHSENAKDIYVRPLWRSFKSRVMLYGAIAGLVATSVIGIAVIGFGKTQPASVASIKQMTSVYTTANGERGRIKLPDGSSVLLSVASRLEVPEAFGRQSRELRLEGEAYFDVIHASDAPFVVLTGHNRTTVLGTQFGVRAYDSTETRVAVRSGKVSVNEAVVSAAEVASVNLAGAVTVDPKEDVEASLAFTSGRLVMTDLKLRDVIDDLNRWYDTDVQLGDSAVGNLHVRGALVMGSINDLKGILELTLGIRVLRTGRTLTLYLL